LQHPRKLIKGCLDSFAGKRNDLEPGQIGELLDTLLTKKCNFLDLYASEEEATLVGLFGEEDKFPNRSVCEASDPGSRNSGQPPMGCWRATARRGLVIRPVVNKNWYF
jgi:hypothetical protein